MATGQTGDLPSEYRVFQRKDFDEMREVELSALGSAWRVAVDRVTGRSVRLWQFYTGGQLKNLQRVVSFYSWMRHPKMCPILGYGGDEGDGIHGWLVIKSFPNGSLTEMLQRELDGKAPPEWNDTARSKVIWGVALAMAWFCPGGREFGAWLTTDEIMLDENFEPTVIPVLSSSREMELRFGGGRAQPP